MRQISEKPQKGTKGIITHYLACVTFYNVATKNYIFKTEEEFDKIMLEMDKDKESQAEHFIQL